MEYNIQIFGDRLRGKRNERRLTQDELAELAGVSKSSIYNYEKAIGTSPSAETLFALCKVLECEPNYLMGWSDAK